MADTFLALDQGELPQINVNALKSQDDLGHKPRILLLYGSVREESYSRKSALESARILRLLGCETKMFDPSGLPLPHATLRIKFPLVFVLALALPLVLTAKPFCHTA